MGAGCRVHCNKVSKPVKGKYLLSWMYSIMYFLLTSYTLIMFLKVLSHFIIKIKNFMKYFKEGVLKYFKISMKFLNISEWNISLCVPTTYGTVFVQKKTDKQLTRYWRDEVLRGRGLTPVDGATVDAATHSISVDEYLTCMTSRCHVNDTLKLGRWTVVRYQLTHINCLSTCQATRCKIINITIILEYIWSLSNTALSLLVDISIFFFTSFRSLFCCRQTSAYYNIMELCL